MFLYEGKTLDEWLPGAVEKIVDGFDPLRVVLLGSLARLRAGVESC